MSQNCITIEFRLEIFKRQKLKSAKKKISSHTSISIMQVKIFKFIKKIHSLLTRVKFKVVKNQFFQQKKFQDVRSIQRKFNTLLNNQFIARQLTINTINT